jgi:hypothetical protein
LIRIRRVEEVVQQQEKENREKQNSVDEQQHFA